MSLEKHFADNLIALMGERSIGATELSRRTGVAKSQIDKLVQRRVTSTNVDDAYKLSKYLGVSLDRMCQPSEERMRQALVENIPMLSGKELSELYAVLERHKSPNV